MKIVINIFFHIVLVLILMIFPKMIFAQESFVSIVNPIRGNDFWEDKTQNPSTVVLGQKEILNKYKLGATWLIRYDVLSERSIISALNSNDEKGLFLEITPTWTKEANINYHQADGWHDPGSAFLTGYSREERIKLIDQAFEKFKGTFKFYPKSVGAWWIDAFSLDYMQKKYEITSALIVADQYTTDNYQIWGQYFGTPYYPSKTKVLQPAQTLENKLPIVIVQWATRDPVNGYGKGVEESTHSVQINDYIAFHNLDINYFSKLIDIYTKQHLNKFSHLVIGLENSYSWQEYANEYDNQIKLLSDKKKSGQLSVEKMEDFAKWYRNKFPDLSPEQVIVANDPLGTGKRVVWFMNPFYRAGWFFNEEGSLFRDIRQYIDGAEELCFKEKCESVNFATSATRVLDEISFGNKWILDEGKISDFKFFKKDQRYLLNYANEAGKERTIEFLPRDISIDGKIKSIDGAILEAISKDKTDQKTQRKFQDGSFQWSPLSVFVKVSKFALLSIFSFLIPGFVLTFKLLNKDTPLFKRMFLSCVTGFVALTLIFYIVSLLNFRFAIFFYLGICILLFLKLNILSLISKSLPKKIDRLAVLSAIVIFLGVIFQIIPTFRSGLTFPYGMGFWGPNTHDGVWHISLINQLVKGFPADNPILSNSILKNYHFFYDLLVAAAAFLTHITVGDLVFRFFPILFSTLLGIGSYYLTFLMLQSNLNDTKAKVAAIFGMYFVYFAGSFGWIVEYIKSKTLSGESAFWANQSISFNLNPPFATSLLIIIAILQFLAAVKGIKGFSKILILILLIGSLIGFKAYGAVLVVGTLFFLAIKRIFKKDFSLLYILISSILVSSIFFLLNFQPDQQLIIFSPFWLIHSMIDSMDRVGWVRLSLARSIGLTNNWFKFISAEIISFLIFILGNLGMRFLSLFSVVKIRKVFVDDNLLLFFIFSLFSFLIPILFIQSANPWNIIQFSYYGLYITAIVSGAILAYTIFKSSKYLSALLIIFVLILTPINSVTTASYYLSSPHAIIERGELEALEFLAKEPGGIVLTQPYDKRIKNKLNQPWPLFAYDSTAYVSALSNKEVFVEDEGQNQILLNGYKKRIVASKDFLFDPNLGMKFLQKNKISYIYLQKIFNTKIDSDIKFVKNIFENEETVIYQVEKL